MSSPIDGERLASIARPSATGSGHRSACHSGVVSRQTNRAIRNQVT
jgi:hypothetical protein